MFLCIFFPNRLFVAAQKSKDHGHELRVVKKFPVTRLQRLPAESRALMNERVRSATPEETRPPCRKKVAQSPRWKWPMANVGILEQIWRVEPIWSTTLRLIRICDPHTEQLQLTPAQGELITALQIKLLITALG